jgi:hypothetical protein
MTSEAWPPIETRALAKRFGSVRRLNRTTFHVVTSGDLSALLWRT